MLKHLVLGIFGTGIVLASFAMAMAQDEAAAGAGDETAVARVANLGAEAQIQEGRTIVARGDRLSQRISNMLSEARRESDIIRMTCLNDKLTQVNANLRNAQRRLQALTDAVDPDRRNHEYTVLTVLGQKFQTLDQEANQCVGQDIFEVGATRVVTDVDPTSLPDEVPTSPPAPAAAGTPTVGGARPSSTAAAAPAIPPPASGTF